MSVTKLLVANRGEIACRVIRTARALGFGTVAVFSDADAAAPHVALADEAVRLGPAPAAESYLRIDALLAAARATGADAVHPGYGFLSERADFAQACAGAGLAFVGPPAAAIAAMGDKAGAKRRMREAGVPCAPGYLGEDQAEATMLAEARRLGTPLLVKAVAGGGGRGMRLVHDLAQLPEALAGARREALAAFGDGTLMLERLVERGRHVEIQVFADAHGNVIHLGERDCTAQRRRQKVVEEAPSPAVSPALRARMGADAVAAAKAVGYVGAGTIEFIVDAEGRHFFLEMNTRLQVEHPVTECVTGLDLVEWQLRIAAGEPLPLRQDEVRFTGHAIEVRLCAEDPAAGFAPQAGRIRHWRPAEALCGRDAARERAPASVGAVRVDDGIREGGEVTPFYDAMVAKLVAHGRDRDDAIRRLRAALADAPLVGVATNGRFLRDLLDHPAFRGAAMHTTMIDGWAAAGEPIVQRPPVPEGLWRLAAAVLAWQPGGRRRPAGVAGWTMRLSCDGQLRRLRVEPAGDAVQVAVLADGAAAPAAEAAAEPLRILAFREHRLRWAEGPVQRACTAVRDEASGALWLVHDAAVFRFEEASPWPQREETADPRLARAPVAGTVAAVAVAVGDEVEAGAPLVCVEAMKMELWQHAAARGRVVAVRVAPRQSVDAGAVLVELDTDFLETPP